MRSLTEEQDDAEEDGHQGAGAQASGEEQRLHAARAQVPPAVTATHADGQRAGAALDRVVVVRDDHGQVVDAYFMPVEPTPPGQDTGRVICQQAESML